MVGILVLRPVNVYHLFYIMVIWYIWYHDMVDFLQSALTACQCLLLFIAVDETGNWRGALEIRSSSSSSLCVNICICVFVYLCIYIHVFQAKYSFPPGGWVVGEANFRPLTIVWTEIDTSSSSAGGATLFGYILQNSLAIILKYCRISSSGAKENGGDTFVFIVKSRGGPWSPNQVPIIWQTQHCWVNSVKS